MSSCGGDSFASGDTKKKSRVWKHEFRERLDTYRGLAFADTSVEVRLRRFAILALETIPYDPISPTSIDGFGQELNIFSEVKFECHGSLRYKVSDSLVRWLNTAEGFKLGLSQLSNRVFLQKLPLDEGSTLEESWNQHVISFTQTWG